MENLLENFSEDFKHFFEHFPNPIFILPYKKNKYENFLAINKAASKLYGYNEGFKKLSYKDISCNFINNLPLYDYKDFEDIHIKKSGEKFLVKVTTSNFKIKNKNFLFFTSNLIEKADNCLETIKKHEIKFKTIFNGTPDSAVLINIENGKIIEVNKSFTENTGYSKEEVIGKEFLSLDIFANPDDKKKFINSFKEEDILINFELNYKNNYGEISPALCSVSFFQIEKNTFMLMIFRDISELKRHERLLRKTVEEKTRELILLNRELEAFSHSVSHELKSPLRAISGFAKILQEDYSTKLDKEANRLISIINENSLKMIKLINDLLNFSKISQIPMSITKVNFSQIVKSIFYELTDKKKRDIIKLVTYNIHDAYVDPILIKQVFTNLLSNAIKFSLVKKKPVIEVGSFVEGGKVIYFVKDNGIGFNMDYSEKLFKIFQKLHRNEKFEGTGVGLSIVERIISRHGGKIWAESEEDKGTTFYFTLSAR